MILRLVRVDDRVRDMTHNGFFMDENSVKWDKRFLDLAQYISQWSKDPSTQVGAVIVDKDKRVVSLGYNGFPRGVNDSEERYNERETKYSLVVHAEINAILFAQKGLKNTTLYTWPLPPCDRCTGFIIQSGIENIVSLESNDEALKERWKTAIENSEKMLEESNVHLRIYGEGVWQGL